MDLVFEYGPPLLLLFFVESLEILFFDDISDYSGCVLYLLIYEFS